MTTDLIAGAHNPVTSGVIRVLNYPPPGDDEYPTRRSLGQVSHYAPGSPQDVARLRTGMQDLINRLRHDAVEIDRALTSAHDTGWQGDYATRFHAVVDQLPALVRGRLIPTLETTVARLAAYQSRLEALQHKAQEQIQAGEGHEAERIMKKQRKDREVRAAKLAFTPEAGSLKSQMRADQRAFVGASSELESLRSEKRQQDLLLAQDLDEAAVDTNQVTTAVVEASTYAPVAGPGPVGTVPTPDAGTGGGGSTTPTIEEIDGGTGDARQTAGGGVPTPPVDLAPVTTTTDGSSSLLAGGGTTVDGQGLGEQHRLDPRFPVGPGTDLSGMEIGHDGNGPELAAAGAVGALALGGAALASRRGAGGTTDDDDGDPASGGASVAGRSGDREATSDDSAPEHADGGVGLGLPIAVVAASAVVGLLVAALGGGLSSSATQRVSKALGSAWDASGRRVLGRKVIEELTERTLDQHDSMRDDAAPDVPAIVVLPGGLTADVPGSWTIARDEHCAVLTPGPAGSFAANLVVVLDPSMPSDPLAGVADLPSSILLEHAALDGAVDGGRARFGYAAGAAPLTVHRHTVDTPEGTVVLTASVATSRIDEDGGPLDRVLASLRPAAC